MQWTGWIGLAVGMLMVTSTKVGPPPVILELGPVIPSPGPTPKPEARKRLITTITVQNSPQGDTVVSFEATDVAHEGGDKFRTLAAKTYSLAEEKPELKDMKDGIMHQVRELERAMLKYVEKAGPPKERPPLEPSQQPSGSRR